MDPVVGCNLACLMCHYSNKDIRSNLKGIFKQEEIKQIAKIFFPKSLQLVIGCGSEPTLYKNFPEIIRLAKSYKLPFVSMVTNGQLLEKEHIEKFFTYQLDELILSVHGVHKNTYEKFMERASYDKLIELLETLTALKRQNSSSALSLRINYTVNPDNLSELENFFDIFGKYNINTIQVRPMFDISGTYRNFNLDTKKFNHTIDILSEQCKKHNVILLADKINPSEPKVENVYESVLLNMIWRFISPMKIWREEYRWKEISYRQYVKQIKWKKYLLKSVFSSKENLKKGIDSFKDSLKYEIQL